MFNFLKDKISKIAETFTTKAASLFSRSSVDEDLLRELEILLISSDAGYHTTQKIMTSLREEVAAERISDGAGIQAALQTQLEGILATPSPGDVTPTVIMLVGINGSGKTTFAAKIAALLKAEGKKVLLVAGDTFRAAATQQLGVWGEKTGTEVYVGKDGQDPASVIFDACTKFKEENFDHIIIDTAGRLQTKVNLMRELEKMRKIITKQLPDAPVGTWLTIDAMLGQNSFAQAEIFHKATKLDGLILTKLDGTGKGGIVFAITQKLGVPILYITFGEQPGDVKAFDASEYVQTVLGQS